MKNKEKELRAGLTKEIYEVESALSDTYQNIQVVEEEGLLDFYAYLIKAYESKHQFLIKKLRQETSS